MTDRARTVLIWVNLSDIVTTHPRLTEKRASAWNERHLRINRPESRFFANGP